VRNVWHASYDLHDAPKTGYHGYWAQNFLDIDPHLVSAHSLDGRHEYPDTREGRMQHYKDLVELAHSKGIKIVQDIVCNHAGPVFYYDANDNGSFDRKQGLSRGKPAKVRERKRKVAYINNVRGWRRAPPLRNSARAGHYA